MAHRTAAVFALGLAACSLGGDVSQDGEYVFLPGSHVVDTVAYPLEHLMVIEDDGDTGRAYVYLFSGQLGRAGLGLPDVRRLAAQSQGFQMAFETPRARYADAPVPSRGLPLTLRMGDQSFELSRLDDDGLTQSGARRWLSSTDSGDFEVRAYFGVLSHHAPLTELAIELPDDELSFEPELTPSMPAATVADETLHVAFLGDDRIEPEPLHADNLVVDLWQAITPADAAGGSADDDAGVAPAVETEAIVRLTVPTGGEYTAGAPLVTDAAGKGCWSAERPLAVRVDQVFRRYLPRGKGDLAVIHHRFDGTTLAAAQWTPLLAEPDQARYCEGFE
jgi:hypothetical protein